jgi:hypothetical protein
MYPDENGQRKPKKPAPKILYVLTISEANRMVSAVVVDGVTVGRPCCAVHNCQIPLASNRDRYCLSHQSLNSVFVIVGCNAQVVAGKKSCHRAEHQEIEHVHTERGQALFQLKERLKRAQVAHPNDAISNDTTPSDDEQTFQVDQRGVTFSEANKPATNQRRICAQFRRRRTHNEQVIVAPCGMILARETFYGAEAVSTVVVSDLSWSFPALTLFGQGNDQANVPHSGSHAEPHLFRQQLHSEAASQGRP